MRIAVRFICMLLLLAALAAAVVYFGAQELQRWSVRKRYLSEPVVIEFPRGTSLKMLSQQLASAGVIDRPWVFALWVRLYSNYSRFQAGTYRFEGRVSPRKAARHFIMGKVYRPVVLQFTIPEAFTFKQLAERLAALNVGTAADFSALFNDKSFLAELNIPSSTLEGYLYPATYSFTQMPTPREALRRAVLVFWEQLPTGYESAVREKGLSLNQAVTFASLIELETPQPLEKPLISEVIWRRLGAKMPLGIDAAIIYGISDYRGNISAKHLKDASNPYNTRMHVGLPPTPIGSPARESLLAVLFPSAEGNYYFVVDSQQPGRHVFSKNFAEHSKKVKSLVQVQRNAAAQKQPSVGVTVPVAPLR